MYWKFHAAPSASVDELLSKENVTLEQLLDEEDIIQECKAQNAKVIDFLIQPDVLLSLVSHLVTEPEPAGDVTAQYRYANMASEVVTCNIPAISDQLASERPLLERLYSLLEQPAPLNPLLASFFSRTLALLIVRRPDQSWYSYQFNCLQVLEFLKSKETFIDLLLRHLGTSAIMDLACNLISGIDAQEYRQNALNWLNDQRLVLRLAELMGDSEHPERQANAGQVVISVVSCARQVAQQLGPGEREPNPLVSAIETTEFVSTVLDGVLGDSESESGLVNAVHVLRLLLDTGRGAGSAYSHNEADEEAPPEEPASVSAVTEAVLPRLAELHRSLVCPPPRPAINTTCGRLSPPLGATRLQLARLTAALLAANRPQLNGRLAELGTIDVLLDLFFKYSLNNFLHSQVEQCITLILQSEPQENEEGKSCHPLLVHIFQKTKLVQRILEGMEEPQANGETAEQRRCCRSLRAYRGHLVNMANRVCSASEEGPNAELVRQQLDALPEEIRDSWQAFTEAKLNRINEKNKPVLPETRQDSSSESDYRAVTDAQQAAIVRTFHNFQLLNAASAACGMADQLSEDEYNDIGDHLTAPSDQLTPAGLLTLDVSAGLRSAGSVDLFADREEADPWPARRGSDERDSSSDEEDEDESPSHVSMEVDAGEPWVAEPAAVPPPGHLAMDTALWEAAPAPPAAPAPAPAPARDWADFSAFPAPAAPAPAPAQQQSTGEAESSNGGQPAAAAAAAAGFHASFETAFSHTCAVQEQQEQEQEPPPLPASQPPTEEEERRQAAGMEVQPELLVAEPVQQPRPESPHELNGTGGDFTPLFHESSPAAAAPEPPAEQQPETGGDRQQQPCSDDAAALADNYSYLTSQGLMNGTPEGPVQPESADRTSASKPGEPAPSAAAAAHDVPV